MHSMYSIIQFIEIHSQPSPKTLALVTCFGYGRNYYYYPILYSHRPTATGFGKAIPYSG